MCDTLARKRLRRLYKCKISVDWYNYNQPYDFNDFTQSCLSHTRLSLNKQDVTQYYQLKGLILAQSERWRRGLGMQVERERVLRCPISVANG